MRTENRRIEEAFKFGVSQLLFVTRTCRHLFYTLHVYTCNPLYRFVCDSGLHLRREHSP